MIDNFDKGSGIYCFFPFERFDKRGKGVVKIGNTDVEFQKRLQHYHTYFVKGVWKIGYIKVVGGEHLINYKSILNEMEKYCIEEIEALGGEVIVDERRKRNKGRSEWVYTDIGVVKKAFQNAIKKFKVEYPDLKIILDFVDIRKTRAKIKANYLKQLKLKNYTTCEYIYEIENEK